MVKITIFLLESASQLETRRLLLHYRLLFHMFIQSYNLCKDRKNQKVPKAAYFSTEKKKLLSWCATSPLGIWMRQPMMRTKHSTSLHVAQEDGLFKGQVPKYFQNPQDPHWFCVLRLCTICLWHTCHFLAYLRIGTHSEWSIILCNANTFKLYEHLCQHIYILINHFSALSRATRRKMLAYKCKSFTFPLE